MKAVRYVPLGREVMRIEIDVNWLNLSKDDQAFVFDIVDRIRAREARKAELTPSGVKDGQRV